MIELFVFAVALVALGWIWRRVLNPAWHYFSVRQQLAKGIVTLRLTTVNGSTETADGVTRQLSESELSAYAPHLVANARFLAVFRYGTDTGIRVKETYVVSLDGIGGQPFSFEAFNLRRPGMRFDTSYPFNESRTSSEFVSLVLRHADRWKKVEISTSVRY